MQYRNGAIYVKPEKIIKAGIVKQPNLFKKDYTYFLTARFSLHGIRHNLMVSRMVYFCFIGHFDLEDQELVVICKDTNNFNICPSNLLLVTRSHKQQRTIARKRFSSPFLAFTDEDRQKQRKAILQTLSKQVTQYNLKGKKVNTYTSAAEAERATGVFATAIGQVAAGTDVSAGGFIWRWGHAPKVDVLALRAEKRKAYVEKYGQKVTQYDLLGHRIACYPGIREASEASGAHVNAICKVLKGTYKSAKGFFWKKGYGKAFIDLSGYAWGRASMAITQSKPVKQYSLEGKYIQTFPSVKMAAQSAGLHPTSVVDTLKGRQFTSGGYKWKYA